MDLGAFELYALIVDANGPYRDGVPVGEIHPNDVPPIETGSPRHPFDTIEEALDRAERGQTVLVLPGKYLAPDFQTKKELRFEGKDVIVSSIDPADPTIIDRTVLQGTVIFSGNETPACTLSGFTIRHAEGGIFGNHTRATISYCKIVGNGPCGATVLKACDGLIKNCLIADNTTFFFCGTSPVVSECSGVFKNCTIANNISGVSVGSATLENCILYYDGDTQLSVEAGKQAIMRYSCIRDSTFGLAIGPGQLVWGPGNISNDPRFVSLGEWTEDMTLIPGDYHLKSFGWRWTDGPIEIFNWTVDAVTSPCIDAGDPNDPLADEPLRFPWDPNNELGVNRTINMGFYGGTRQASMAPPLSDLLPKPDPMQWDSYSGEPQIRISGSRGGSGGSGEPYVSMSAKQAVSPAHVDYFFECLSDPNLSSGWQGSSSYQLAVIPPQGTLFRVRARNIYGQTGWSEVAALDQDNIPPMGSLLFTLVQVETHSVTLGTKTLIDPEGLEYFFDREDSEQADSGWIRFPSGQEPNYTFTDLNPGEHYRFRFKVRDRSVYQLETEWSAWLSVTTDEEASGLTPDPMTWAVGGAPSATQIDPALGDWGWGLTMTATEAVSDSGEPVFYDIDCMGNDAFDANHLDETTYTLTVGHKSLVDDFSFRVRAVTDEGAMTEWSQWARAEAVP